LELGQAFIGIYSTGRVCRRHAAPSPSGFSASSSNQWWGTAEDVEKLLPNLIQNKQSWANTTLGSH